MAVLGQITIDEISIFSVSVDPSIDGFLAPIGSIATLDDDTNGRLWIKSGSGNTAWSSIPRLASATNLTTNRFVFPDANGFLQTTAVALWDGAGRFAFGSNAPTAPQSTIHLDRGTGLGTHIRMTAGTTTGVTSGDGTEFGIDDAGNAEIRQYENSAINFLTNNTRYGQFAAAGQFILGPNANPVDITGASVVPTFQIIGTADQFTQMAAIRYSADTVPAVFNLLKSRGAINTQGILSSGDELGRLQFRGSDGVNFQAGASVRAAVDSAPAAGSMPGRLLLQTTPSGSTTPVTALTIDSTQFSIFTNGIRIGNASTSVAGNIRYTGTDFQGYVGGTYQSFTGTPYFNATNTATLTTTSSTDVVMDSLTVTPTAGTYLVVGGTTLQSNNSGATVFVSIWSAGAQVAASERRAIPQVDASGGLGGSNSVTLNLPVMTQAVVTVNGAQAVELRWRRTAGTATAQQGTLTAIRLSL